VTINSTSGLAVRTYNKTKGNHISWEFVYIRGKFDEHRWKIEICIALTHFVRLTHSLTDRHTKQFYNMSNAANVQGR